MNKDAVDNIFYDEIMGDERFIMTKNTRNWIWAHGSKDSPIKTILSSKNTAYYTSIESMLVHLLEKRFREHVSSLTSENFKRSLRKAFTEVRSVSKELDAISWDVIKRGDYCKHCNKMK
jgi:hypothetical protein|tara:strand:+ start:65 stop:421 length:357 start_codon:yes stop_codon:yes gene_type:complete